MNINQETNIGELVALNYKAAAVFKTHKIDFCCNGNRSIDEVCKNQNIDSSELIKKLEKCIESNDNQNIDYKSWPSDLLADYIEKKHHRYVEEKIFEIKPYLERLCEAHGQNHPELFEVKDLFFGAAGELTAHMKKEEFILFPFVRKMIKLKQEHLTAETPHFGKVENPISMMMNEHETEGVRFAKIAQLTNDYNPPSDACTTYKVTFALLKEFEEDLHLHIHLENNILFPSAVELEKELIMAV